jgi:hypothetical protein
LGLVVQLGVEQGENIGGNQCRLKQKQNPWGGNSQNDESGSTGVDGDPPGTRILEFVFKYSQINPD